MESAAHIAQNASLTDRRIADILAQGRWPVTLMWGEFTVSVQISYGQQKTSQKKFSNTNNNKQNSQMLNKI